MRGYASLAEVAGRLQKTNPRLPHDRAAFLAGHWSAPNDAGEYATIAAFALPSLDAVGDSMYESLQASGNRPVRALQRLSALLLNAEQARLLQTREGDAGLCVERLGFVRDGRAVEFCRSYFRGDMYDFVAELNAS
jgi:GntR family transcriptional regulator